MAVIHVRTGPMACSKTAELMKFIHMYSNVNRTNVLLINFSGDNRTDSEDGVSTHMYGDSSKKVLLGKYIIPLKTTKLFDIPEDVIQKYNVIGIDEGQFYDDLEDFIRKYHRDYNKIFFISGLSFDSENRPFGQIANLLDIATTFEKMTAICPDCNPKEMSPASFTYYNGKKDSVVQIGGLELYKPLCALHYYFNMSN